MAGALLYTILHMWLSLRPCTHLWQLWWLQEPHLQRRRPVPLPHKPQRLQQQLQPHNHASRLLLNLSPSLTLNHTHTPIHTTQLEATTATATMRPTCRPRVNQRSTEARAIAQGTMSSDQARLLDRHLLLPCIGHELKSMVRSHLKISVLKQ